MAHNSKPLVRLSVPVTLMFDLSVEANPRAALAALRGIDVRIVGSRERGGQFALPLPAPGGTAFHRESFGVLRRGAARRSPGGDLRRPHDLLRPSAGEA